MSDLSQFFFSSPPAVVRYQLIELSHPNFTQTYRLVRNATNGLYVKHEGSAVPTFYTYMPMRLEEIGTDNSLDQSLEVSFGDLGSYLPLEIELISKNNAMDTKPTLVYREYRSDEIQMEGIAGGEWIFDGVDDLVSMGDELDFDITDPFSFTGWFKTTSSDTMALISKKNISPSIEGYTFQLFDGGVQVILEGASGGLDLIAGQFNDGDWHFFAITKTSSTSASGIKVYVDGFEIPTSVGSNSLSGSMVTSAFLRIGMEGASNKPFEGTLKHFAVWDKRLSQSEVIEVFGGGSPPELDSLSFFGNCLAWWRLDFTDTIGLAGVADQTGNSHDGTPDGGIAPSDTEFGPVVQAPINGPITLEVTNVTFNKQGSTFTAKPKTFSMARTGEFYTVQRFPMLAGFL